ncbi:MAG: methylenetetrahydrofolate--tRNA-(uracil(54)-C(5))-methyltransferase (FADH(2)-oxidizing) TrmFO [Spartobacteria bacterium]|nr:methylenetetrahydrofolate--tRNA-(uracil(54)-C(5))-methyltransferase (FADH(2)-oxidizing) TrmFO [Spartobacteria bacterium]
MSSDSIKVIGGGLAGCEAAWQAAEQGLTVELFEMRPVTGTAAHKTDYLAELVCSNSLGSALPDRATGLLQNELRGLGSMLMECAETARVPAGGALAVDRERFAMLVTEHMEEHPRITLKREEVVTFPEGPVIVATGPLTSDAFSRSLVIFTGEDRLFFYDALAPLIAAESINMDVAFKASRYDRGDSKGGDYINCPFNRDEYFAFVEALKTAQRITLKDFEKDLDTGVTAGKGYFESCLPVEVIAGRGDRSLSFGPMRPVGLIDPRTDRRAYAVLQLRQDNLAASLYNMVGFQTNLTYGEQQRVFRMVPGLEQAEFERFGQMHRNTFVMAPKLLDATLQTRLRPDVFMAGQVTGVEGYAGSIGAGLIAGSNIARYIKGQQLLQLPLTSMLGALLHYISHAEPSHFQPMKANFGILPALASTQRLKKRERALGYVSRGMRELETYVKSML